MSVSQSLNLAIGLPLRNSDELTHLLQELYDPQSPNYRKFLTPDEFAARFGPTEADYQSVAEFARTNGLSVTATHPNRLLLDVAGKVGDVEKAFHLTLRTYRHPREARDFYAPDAEPTVDARLAILHVSGLDNYSIPHPANLIKRPSVLASPARPNSGSGTNGSYAGGDFRAAYVPGVSLTGTGQTVGLFQMDGFYQSDITAYEKSNNLPNVPLQTVLIDGFNGVPTTGANSGNGEVSLDIEMVISMAPGISKVIVYEAPNNTAYSDDVVNRMATDNAARQLSCSWGWGGGPDTNADQSFIQMAAQGQSFFSASGDSDAFTGSTAGQFPSDDPYITQVGGTTLTTAGPGGAYVSETVWNWGLDNGSYVGSSGGISTVYGIPAWQRGVSMAANGGSTTKRNLPDVALTGDNVSVTYGNGTTAIFGGTSCAAPLWAGFTALVNQLAAQTTNPPVGFVNPAIYALGKGPNYAACFHDITTGNNFWPSSPNNFNAVAGFDLCTGWGTPAGSNLIAALAIPVKAPLVVTNGYTLTAETCTNGAIDPGETVTVSFSLINAGNVNTTNLVAALLATNGVTAPGGSQTYGTLSTNGTAVARPFSFTANGTCGSNITAVFQLQNNGTNFGTANFTLPLGALVAYQPLAQNFDGVTAPALPSGWTTTKGGGESLWTTTTAQADTAPNSAFSPDASSVGSNALYSPFIPVISSSAQLTFRHYYNLRYSGSYGAYSAGVLEIKIGGGAFQDILAAGGSFVTGGYDQVASSHHSNPLAGRSCWGNNSGGFITTTVNLPASAAGQTVQLRWVCATGSNSAGTGWYVDSISLADNYFSCCTGIAASADVAIVGSVTPAITNLGGGITFTLGVTNLGPVTATNVVVSNTLPAGLTFASVTPKAIATNANTFSFALGNLAANAGTNVIIQVTAGAAGSWTNIASVSAGTSDTNSANNSARVSVSVNSPPVISTPASYATNQDAVAGPLPFTIGDAETAAAALTLTASSSNTNLVVNSGIVFGGAGSNRTVSVTPVAGRFGSTTITLTVSDGLASTSTAFLLTFNAVNHAPVLAPIADRAIYELTTLMFTNSASDPDTNSLTFSLAAGAPTNATIGAASGVFTWTPTHAQSPSSNHIAVIVTDNGTPPLSATQGFTVTVLQSNVPPVLAPIADQVIYESTLLSITNVATDSNLPPQTLTFSLDTNAPAGAAINPTNGLFAWTPTHAQSPSSNHIVVIVTDNGTPPLSATQSFTVTVLQSNVPPVLAPIADQVIYESTLLSITNVATDSNLPPQTLTFSLDTNAPAGATINPTNGLFAWTPTHAQSPSSNHIVVIVTDNGTPPLSATQSFTVTVLQSNVPPVLAPIADQVIYGSTLLSITNVATDSNLPPQTLTFSLDTNAPPGAAIDPVSGVFTWAPGPVLADTTNRISVIVMDDGVPPLGETQNFAVVVSPPPTIRSVTVSNSVAWLTWDAIAGQGYRLQTKGNLDDSNWNSAGDFQALSNLVTGTNVLGPTVHTYYRVQALP